MICKICRQAGDLAARGKSEDPIRNLEFYSLPYPADDPLAHLPEYLAALHAQPEYLAALHAQCKGSTWCDCQHKKAGVRK